MYIQHFWDIREKIMQCKVLGNARNSSFNQTLKTIYHQDTDWQQRQQELLNKVSFGLASWFLLGHLEANLSNMSPLWAQILPGPWDVWVCHTTVASQLLNRHRDKTSFFPMAVITFFFLFQNFWFWKISAKNCQPHASDPKSAGDFFALPLKRC